jgi:TonB family protein
MPRHVINPLPNAPRPEPFAALVSAVTHVLIVSAMVAAPALGTMALESMGVLPEGLRFLVPPSTSPAPAQAAMQFSERTGDNGTSFAEHEGAFGDLRAGSRVVATVQQEESSTASAMDAEAEIAAMNALLANAYQVLEVDSAAARDPSSAAPVYPPELESRGIEGHVIVRFVVDSTGMVDMASVMTVESTRVEFDRAVRAAMPRMKFRPAMVGDRPVRQLAEQLFQFEIPKEP